MTKQQDCNSIQDVLEPLDSTDSSRILRLLMAFERKGLFATSMDDPEWRARASKLDEEVRAIAPEIDGLNLIRLRLEAKLVNKG